MTALNALFDAARPYTWLDKKAATERRKQGYECGTCGTHFVPKRASRNKYCSRACGAHAHLKAAPIKDLEAHCGRCGIQFTPRRREEAKFCSRGCAHAFLSQRWASVRPEVLPSSKVYFRHCERCDHLFTAKTTAPRKCDECRRYQPKPKMVRLCSCGAEIFGTAAKRSCQTCRRRKDRATQQAKHGRVKKHRHRARKYGVAYEAVDPLKVFDRDGWRCQLCGVKTPKRLRGKMVDQAPELDHIIPMSVGGEHSYLNTQCACRKCNGLKGARPLGQMRLVA